MKTNNRYTQLGNIRGILRLVKTVTTCTAARLVKTATCTTALILAAACSNELPQESDATNNGNGSQGTPITLIANVPTGDGADTRIDFDDKGTDGVKLSWTQGDAFKLFTNTLDQMEPDPVPVEAGLFTLTTPGTNGQGSFSGVLTAGMPANGYAAYYPASKFLTNKNGDGVRTIPCTGQVQDGNDNRTHLADYNFMSASGIKDLTQPITFKPMMTLLTFKLTMPDKMNGAPIELKLKTDESVFKEKMFSMSAYSNEFRLGLKNITLSDDRLLTAHMLVYCDDLTKKSLSTIVSTSTGEIYTYTATVTKKYEKGKRYTATIAADDWDKTISPGLFDNNVAASEGTAPTAETGVNPGTFDNPYLIASAAHLQYLVKNPSTNNYYKLTTDIYVTADKWTPIGNYNSPFQGKGFDGNGNIINGVLNMDETSDSNSFYYGFFGGVQAGSSDPTTIKNLNVNADVEVGASTYTGSNKDASIFVGGIAGYISSGNSAPCSIENCSFNGEMTVADITSNTATPSFRVGGIVGGSTGGSSFTNSLSNCTNTGIINSPTISNTDGILSIGGILGRISGNKIKLHTCLNAGTVNITSLNNIHYGGLSGDSFNNTSNFIYNCCNHTGTINVNGTPASPNKWTDDDPTNWTPKACDSGHTQR